MHLLLRRDGEGALGHDVRMATIVVCNPVSRAPEGLWLDVACWVADTGNCRCGRATYSAQKRDLT